MRPKFRDFHEFSSFLKSCREASRKLLGRSLIVPECLRVSSNDFWIQKSSSKKSKMSRFSRDLLSVFGISVINEAQVSD